DRGRGRRLLARIHRPDPAGGPLRHDAAVPRRDRARAARRHPPPPPAGPDRPARPPDVSVRRYWALQSLTGSALVAGLLCLIALWGWAGGGDHTKLTHFFINVVIVLSLQVFSGNSGILSFGQMAFVGTGAYVAGILTFDPALQQLYLTSLPHFMLSYTASFGVAVLLAAAAGAALALVSGIPILRLDGASAVIAILSLLLIADVVFGAWTGVTRGGAGLVALPPLVS